VLPSAFASLNGLANPLNLPKSDHVIVVMVDGLGRNNLKARSSVAPNLSTQPLTNGLTAAFPSSTVANITSLATGVTPSQHGLFGYRIFDRPIGVENNLLTGMDKYSILDYLKQEPLSSTHRMNAITLPAYAESGFTRATMHGATHHFGASIADRFKLAAELSRESGVVSYLYVPELDQCAHSMGWQSQTWAELLADLDAAVGRLLRNIGEHVGVLVVADHGIVDVDKAGHIYLDEIFTTDELLSLGGDPRSAYLYLDGDLSDATRRLTSWLGDRAELLTAEEMFDAGLLGEELRGEPDLIPDLVLLAAEGHAIYHRGLSKAASMRMVGQHGGLSSFELEIPLVRLGAYSSSSDLVP
jgi:predicted AlkP superfamily pyrophosphatase or phosphodiesterase